MTTRRAFLASAPVLGFQAARLSADATFTSRRPPLAQRKFTSPAVEARIEEIKRTIGDPELGWMFENCFPNTLDTTVRTGELDGKPDTFVITGDIDAMWLRDSTAQVWPYLPLAKQDPKLRRMLAGVINRQTRCVLIDPYANAFNYGPTGSPWAKDLTRMKPRTARAQVGDRFALLHGPAGLRLLESHRRRLVLRRNPGKTRRRLIVQTFREQQRMKDHGPYRFQRSSAVPTDTLPHDGYGNPAGPAG